MEELMEKNLSQGRIFFTKDENITLQIVGKHQALKKFNPHLFFDSFEIKE